jgi:uncharacterized protein (DUF2164 family)
MLAGMNLNVAKEQKAEIVESLRRFAAEELEAEWSEVRAGFVLEYFLKEIGPLLYNQGVEDAQKFLRRAVEDLPGTCFEEPMRYWDKEGCSRGVRRKSERYRAAGPSYACSLRWCSVILFPSGSRTTTIRQIGPSCGPVSGSIPCSFSVATAASKSVTSNAAHGPSWDGFHICGAQPIASVPGPRSYSINA